MPDAFIFVFATQLKFTIFFHTNIFPEKKRRIIGQQEILFIGLYHRLVTTCNVFHFEYRLAVSVFSKPTYNLQQQNLRGQLETETKYK